MRRMSICDNLILYRHLRGQGRRIRFRRHRPDRRLGAQHYADRLVGRRQHAADGRHAGAEPGAVPRDEAGALQRLRRRSAAVRVRPELRRHRSRVRPGDRLLRPCGAADRVGHRQGRGRGRPQQRRRGQQPRPRPAGGGVGALRLLDRHRRRPRASPQQQQSRGVAQKQAREQTQLWKSSSISRRSRGAFHHDRGAS